jgi:N-acetylglucosaminyldiphosphoundecaprenol N-acetyl-beta-D-mannosaminyltransferase
MNLPQIASLLTLPEGGLGKSIHLCNAHTLALASKDETYARLLRKSWLNLPDGTPVAWAGHYLHRTSVRSPVRGASLLRTMLTLPEARHLSHYFYGSSESTLKRLIAEVRSRYPGARIAGYKAPPFRTLTAIEWGTTCDDLVRSDADLVWVGLGTPKQDFFAAEMCEIVTSTFICVGAAFDFTARTVREAPPWLQGSGLEWAYRFAREPRRLARRYTNDSARFVWEMARRREWAR